MGMLLCHIKFEGTGQRLVRRQWLIAGQSERWPKSDQAIHLKKRPIDFPGRIRGESKEPSEKLYLD